MTASGFHTHTVAFTHRCSAPTHGSRKKCDNVRLAYFFGVSTERSSFFRAKLQKRRKCHGFWLLGSQKNRMCDNVRGFLLQWCSKRINTQKSMSSMDTQRLQCLTASLAHETTPPQEFKAQICHKMSQGPTRPRPNSDGPTVQRFNMIQLPKDRSALPLTRVVPDVPCAR